MKSKYLIFCIGIQFLTSIVLAGNSINTEDLPRGIVLREECLSTRANVRTDARLLKFEKKQFRAEKRIAWFSKVINHKMAKSQYKDSGAGQTKMSMLSMIFGAGGFLFLFIPYVGFVGLLLAIAGFVIGLVSMKKEGSNVFNILGVVFGGFTLLLFVFAVIIIASWGFF